MRPHNRLHLPSLIIAVFLLLSPTGFASPLSPQGIQYRVHTKIGFRSEKALANEYRRYSRAFGRITVEEFLRMAQDLRDRPLDMKILEGVTRDGIITRFDRRTKAYIAFQKNLVILTFFRPEGGEKYFYSRLKRARRR